MLRISFPLLFLLFPLLLWATPNGEVLLDRIVAIVNGHVITSSELQRATSMYKRSGAPLQGTEKELTRKMLDELIANKLISAEVKKLGREASDLDVQQAIDNIKTQNHLSDAELVTALGSEGKTFEEYKAEMKLQIERFSLTNHVMQQRVAIKEDDIRAYYEQKYGATGETEITLEYLRFATDASGEAATLAAVEAILPDLSADLSSDPSFADAGTRFPTLPLSYGSFGRLFLKDLQDEMRQHVTPLDAGSMSPPVLIRSAYYIFRVGERRVVNRTTYEERRDELRQELINREGDKHIGRWLEDLRKKATVDIKDKDLE